MKKEMSIKIIFVEDSFELRTCLLDY